MSPYKNKASFSLLILLALVVHCLAAPSQLPSGLREWKSNKGTSIKATVVYLGDTTVMLKTETGKEISVPIKSLIEADRDFIKNLKQPTPLEEKPITKPSLTEKNETTEPEPTPEEEAKKAPQEKEDTEVAPLESLLPVLQEGIAKDYHAYYKGDKYIAKINNIGHMYVTYLDDEGTELPKWKLLVQAQTFNNDAQIIRYKFQKALTNSEAKMNPKEVKFSFLSEAKTTCHVIYEFTPKGFTTWTSSEQTSETPADMKYLMRHYFPNIEKYTDDIKYFKKMSLKMENLSNNSEKFTFEDVEFLKGNIQEFEVRGPLFGKGKIIAERGSEKVSRFLLNTYPGTPLKTGFVFLSTKENFSSQDHKNEKVTFTFK